MFRLSHKGMAPRVHGASLGCFSGLAHLSVSGLVVVFTWCAHLWNPFKHTGGLWLVVPAAPHQHSVSRVSNKTWNWSFGGRHSTPFSVSFVSLVEHVGGAVVAVVFPCFGIDAFDKEASSDCCWFLLVSFVQSRNIFLVFSGYESHTWSWVEIWTIQRGIK